MTPKTGITVWDAKEYLDGQIRRGSSTGAGVGGELLGWRQMRRSLGEMQSDLCRLDAVGRVSKSDLAALTAAINAYREAGKIGPEWNGYLTIRA